jgi:hypothetical protein
MGARPADLAPREAQALPLLARSHTAPSEPRTSEAALSICSLLYLGFLGVVAAAIVAVFFGTGFSLLASSAGGRFFGSARKVAEAVVPLPAPLDHRPAPPLQGTDAVQNFPVPPKSSGGPVALADDPAPQREQAGTSTAIPQGGRSSPVAPPAEASSSDSAPAPVRSADAATGIRELLEHGDAVLRTGDVVSARLFYERAANAGDGRAALRLGATFDPAFLGPLGGKVQADAVLARTWYSRALDLGAVEAKGQLRSLEMRQRK